MQSIRTVQVWGVLTKVATAALAVVQTAIVLRLLGPEAYGIVGVAISIGALVGVSQHVGAVDAAIREIAVADSAARRAAVFWVALAFRVLVTVPISLGLAGGANWIARAVYPFPDMAYLMRLMSVLLIIHGVQGILGGAFTGQRAFGRLYVLQLVMSVVNVPLFTGFVWRHGVRGYFEAAITAALLFSALLAVLLRSALGGTLAFPSRALVSGVFTDIFHTGAWTYVSRILSVAWQRVPILLLGRWAPAETVGLFSAAVTFGSKLQLISAALGEVNLAFLSAAFARSRDEFRRLAERTLEDVGAVTLLGATAMATFANVLVPLLAGQRYAAAIPLIPVIAWGYAAFAFLDIATNTLFVPARQSHLRAGAFAILCGVTISVMVAWSASRALDAGWAVALGAVAGLGVSEMLAQVRMRIPIIPIRLGLSLAGGALITLMRDFPLPVVLLLFTGLVVLTTRVAFPRLVAQLTARLRGGVLPA